VILGPRNLGKYLLSGNFLRRFCLYCIALRLGVVAFWNLHSVFLRPLIKLQSIPSFQYQTPSLSPAPIKHNFTNVYRARPVRERQKELQRFHCLQYLSPKVTAPKVTNATPSVLQSSSPPPPASLTYLGIGIQTKPLTASKRQAPAPRTANTR
jgi:hypothetical protein